MYGDALTFMGAFDNAQGLADSSMSYDCILKVWFEDRKGFGELYRLLREPELAKIISTNEETFLNRDSMRVLVVDEHKRKNIASERLLDGQKFGNPTEMAQRLQIGGMETHIHHVLWTSQCMDNGGQLAQLRCSDGTVV